MSRPVKKFVFTKRDIKGQNSVLVEKDDVGIVESETKDDATVLIVRTQQEVKLNKQDFEIFDHEKVGDGFSKKICNMCAKLLDTSNFAKNQNAKNNRTVRRPSCQECRKELEGASMSLKEKRKWAKKKPYGQSFTCPVCRKTTIAGVTSSVVLDHDHHTGRGRAWICDSCNTGLGRFKDNIELLKNTIKYLRKKAKN